LEKKVFFSAGARPELLLSLVSCLRPTSFYNISRKLFPLESIRWKGVSEKTFLMDIKLQLSMLKNRSEWLWPPSDRLITHTNVDYVHISGGGRATSSVFFIVFKLPCPEWFASLFLSLLLCFFLPIKRSSFEIKPLYDGHKNGSWQFLNT
jgi:hypothetical protein